MAELKDKLASLRIERDSEEGRGGRWGLALVLLFLATAASYYGWTRFQASAEVQVNVVRPTLLGAGAGGEPRRTPVLTASGYIVARRKAVVSAKIQGRLSELRVEEGSRVSAGDVLARLESADQEAQVERARAAMERAGAELAENRRQLANAENLSKDGITMEDETQAARSRVRIGEAALRQAKADLGVFEAYLENTVIKAPFAGIVIKKMAEVGESVAPIPPGVNVSTSSGAIVALADFDTLEAEVDVNESNLAKLHPEHAAETTVDALPERRFASVLRQIIPSADRTKATVLVKVSLLEKDPLLRPEMSARVTFFNEEKPTEPSPSSTAEAPATPTILLPRVCVVARGPGNVVFELAQGKARQRTVELGEQRGDQVVVKSGLGGTEQIIAHPPEGLRDGQAAKARS